MAEKVEKASQEVLDFTSSLTNFTYELYNNIACKSAESNVFISPYSISAALSMVYVGARKNTATQMETAMNINESTKCVIHKAHREYLALLEHSKKEFALKTANRLYVSNNFDVSKEYVEQVKEMYHSPSESIDFTKDAEERINNWVQLITNGKIKQIIPDGVLNADTILVLVNAIYFKGKWATVFDSSKTKVENFFKSSTKSIPVDMMFVKKNFMLRVDKSNKCKILELPYEGESLSMYIILPNQINGLKSLQKNISPEFLHSVVTNNDFCYLLVEVFLPKFKIESSFELTKPLSNLGMTDIFNSMCDLSGISTGSLCVSNIFHNAFVEVNEESTEAAAATAIIMSRCLQRPVRFEANHPFMFLIVDKRAQMIIFIGKLNSP